ncbi:hypothetical protein [Anditalea andensis]|uniref:Uncharacterized protein n=1 Tax=Anditalea andensis TaxID=1048983 RepID=A0A074KS12_9BACT|nr:hypothetical protein [Anditalea andensis]KEO72746.1 hypothetical protein EL17_18635 [Anditalea andensis]
MKGRGIIIWLVGIGLLGLMAAYLFAQSNKNKYELEQQAARNVLIIRENLQESLEALKIEIRAFIVYRLILSSNDKNHYYDAAESIKRDKNKFKFTVDYYSKLYNDTTTFSFGNTLALSGIPLKSIFQSVYKNASFDSINTNLWSEWGHDPKLGSLDTAYLSTDISFTHWMQGGLRKSSFFNVIFLANEKGEILHPSVLAGIKIPFAGKSMLDSFSNSDVSQFTMDISAATFKGYLSPIQIGTSILWVGGLKKQEEMNQAAYSVNYNLMVITALILGLLLLSLPLISFFEMGKGDVLSKNRVYLMGVSLLLIFIMSGFALSFVIYYTYPHEIEKTYAEKIRYILQRDFRFIQNNIYTDYFPNVTEGVKSLKVNEVIRADTKASLVDLQISNHELTPEADFSFINISHRRYLSYFYNKNRSDDIRFGPKNEFFIDRNFSEKNSEPEIVMSAAESDSILKAITFQFTDTLLHTKSKRYLLVKDNGEVILSSDKFEFMFTQIRTALPEDKWENLQTLFKTNKYGSNHLWEFPLHLNGKEYTALVTKFGLADTDSPIWFIYLINDNMNHSLTGLMVVESLIWIALYTVLLILISLGKSFLKKNKGYNWENFSYNSFHPKKITIVQLKRGVIALLIFLLVTFAMLYLFEFTHYLKHVFIVCVFIAGFFMIFNHFFLPSRSKSASSIATHPYSLALFCWLVFIGFIPGFIISSSVFNYEMLLWDRIQENHSEVGNIDEQNNFFEIVPTRDIDVYYRGRSHIFSSMSNGFDPLLRELIYPNFLQFQHSFSNNIGFLPSLSSQNGLFFIFIVFLLICIVFFGIFMLIKKLVRNIYWTDFNIRGLNHLGPFIKQKLSSVKDMRIFLCGCDNLKNRDWIYENLEVSLNEIEVVDYTKPINNEALIGLQQNNKKVLLVENIHCIGEIKDFISKFSLYLKSADGIHLIISSGIAWKKLYNNLNSEVDKIQFSEMFSKFYFEFVSITYTLPGVTNDANVYNEKIIEDYFSKHTKINDRANLRLLLQRYGKAYFYNIWSELSIEEKNVCYSFSKEGFLNYRNKEEIIELFQKGIFTKDIFGGQLHLFSKTFRYFIIAISTEEEIKKIENYRKKNANALNIQWALLSFLLVAFGLLSYFDSSFLTELQSVITGVIGLSTLVLGEIRKIWINKSFGN